MVRMIKTQNTQGKAYTSQWVVIEQPHMMYDMPDVNGIVDGALEILSALFIISFCFINDILKFTIPSCIFFLWH